MDISEDLNSNDSFKTGANDAPTAYVDPKQLDRAYYDEHGSPNPNDVEIIQNMLNEQHDGLGDIIKGPEDIEKYLTSGPTAQQHTVLGETICIINEANEKLDEKAEIIPIMSNIPLDRLNPIPGTDADWIDGTLAHEEGHCNDEPLGAEGILYVLKSEAEQDQIESDHFRNTGKPELSDAFQDYRALASTFFTKDTHATNIFLNTGEDHPGLGIEHIDQAITYETAKASYQGILIDEVAKQEGVSSEKIIETLKANPNQFSELAQEVIESGALDKYDPQIKAMANDTIIDHLNTGNFTTPPESDLMVALRTVENEILQLAQDTHGIDKTAAVEMRENDPATFVEAIKDRLGQDDYKNDNPYLEAMIEDYAGAFERRIKGAAPELEQTQDLSSQPTSSLNNDILPTPSIHANMDLTAIDGGSPTIILEDIPGGCSVEIGGVTACEYFAAVADPDLAEQRITLENSAKATPDFSFAPTEPIVTAATPA